MNELLVYIIVNLVLLWALHIQLGREGQSVLLEGSVVGNSEF